MNDTVKLIIGLLVVLVLSACGTSTENKDELPIANKPLVSENTPIVAITTVPPTKEPPLPIPVEPSATVTLTQELLPTQTSEADDEVQIQAEEIEEAEEEEAIVEPTATAVPATATTVIPATTPTIIPTATVIPTTILTTAPSTVIPTLTAVPATSIPTLTAVPAIPIPTITGLSSSTEGEILFEVANVERDDVLNVRAQAGAEYQIMGVIPHDGANVEILGPSQDINGYAWVPIRYKDITGWVNSYYLVSKNKSASQSVGERAQEILLALENKDMVSLSKFVHPDKGVRFSAYTFVRLEADAYQGADLVFNSAAINTLFSDPTIYKWGISDGIGEPINMTFAQYFERFIYDADFTNPDSIGYDQMIGQGNTINNIMQVYPNATVVEYYLDGTEEYSGLDWRSLRLVLEEKNGMWYLVGVVHDEWTI